MNQAPGAMPSKERSGLLRLLIVGFLLWLTSIIVGAVLNPYEFRSRGPWYISDLAFNVIYALILFYAVRLFGGALAPWRKLLPLAPFVLDTLQEIIKTVALPDYGPLYYNLLSLVFAALNLALLAMAGIMLRRTYITRTVNARQEEPMEDAGTTTLSDLHKDEDDPFQGFGAGLDPHNRVTRSVVNRAISADALARASMVVMVVLVLIGGSASVGLWLSNYVDGIQAVEYERGRLADLNKSIKALADGSRVRQAQGSHGNQGTTPEDYRVLLINSAKTVDDLIRQKYSDEETYGKLLAKIERKSQTSYSDIAIRVTIALLTVFLVQIFFALHKYNRRLAVVLANKAEALELISPDPEYRKLLAKEMIKVIREPSPEFGEEVKTPLEEAAEAAGNLRTGTPKS